MIAITKSPTKDEINKYILALIIVQYIQCRSQTKRPTEAGGSC